MSFFERLFGGHHGGHHGGGHHGGHHDPYGGGYGGRAPPAGSNAAIGCPSCKTLNAPGARFCQQCGVSLVPVACTQCAAPLQPGAKFCGTCGRAASS